jgi:peptidoglycan/xylan/chitin deacetylase (PgdA/CDA1 family)
MKRRNALAAAAAALALAATGCEPGAGVPSGRSSTGGPSGAPTPSPTPPASPALGPLPGEVGTGPRDRANVALTFHGQGDPKLVEQLLAEIESGGARVTVLAVGTWLTAEPTMARRILDGGHELGNHTQNHLAIASMRASQAFTEINTCAQTLKRLTGSIGTWFRPSQTQHATATIEAQAAKVGYPTCLSYDVDSLDYTDPGPDAVVRNTLDAVGNGSIVSLHFGHTGTVTAMPALLEGLRQKGLSAVTMTELMSR